MMRSALQDLGKMLPGGWTLSFVFEPSLGGDPRPDALMELRAPDASTASVVVEGKRHLSAAEAVAIGARLERTRRETSTSGALVVSSYLTPLARARLSSAGISYIDLTGNIRFTLDRPAIFIERRGADRNPSPTPRDSRSLKGGSAARIVRALCDWKPPVGVRELARRSATDPGYVSRVLVLLEREDVITRDTSGGVAIVNLSDLLKRWAEDYAVGQSNSVLACLEPRSTDEFLKRLTTYDKRWALTGSRAVPRGARTAVSRTVSCYVENADAAASVLDLRSGEDAANVFLIEPFDSVIWERTRSENGLTCVATTQCAVDLLTGTGREPSEGEALLGWMGRNQDAWRR